MWIKLHVVQDAGDIIKVPVNMDTIVTYAPAIPGEKPSVNALLYPNGGFIQALCVAETFEEIEAMFNKKTTKTRKK